MDAVVSFITQRPRGGVSRRTQEVSAESVRFGRGADSEVYLPDPRILLHHATLHSRPGGLVIEAEGPVDVRINGEPTRAREVGVGDVLGVGPYDVTIAQPPEGKDVALDVELTRPLGDDLEELQARSKTSLDQAIFSKRAWSWVGFIAVLFIFLVLPMALFFANPGRDAEVRAEGETRFDVSWTSGEISGPHKFIADQCNACHEKPFVQVEDRTCLACHGNVTHHADPAEFTLAEFTETDCASCHKEHEGSRVITLDDQAFCASCHADLGARIENAALLDVSDFHADHPEFRISLVVDPEEPTIKRVTLEDEAALREVSGLKFPHDKHLKPDGVKGPKGKEMLDCGSCHAIERGGLGIEPVVMEEDCERCHRLEFEPQAPERALPHGQVQEAQLVLREFYADMALRRGWGPSAEPAPDNGGRRRPGSARAPQVTSQAQRQDALSWADAKARQVADETFGKRVCGSCHTVTKVANPTKEEPLAWRVATVHVADRWMPKGFFDHESHEDLMECGDCHDAKESKEATDVLMPGIAVCKDCHGGAEADDLVPSTCVMCHEYHLEGLPKMGGEHAMAMTPWRSEQDADDAGGME